jgi:hypothetical protein
LRYFQGILNFSGEVFLQKSFDCLILVLGSNLRIFELLEVFHHFLLEVWKESINSNKLENQTLLPFFVLFGQFEMIGQIMSFIFGKFLFQFFNDPFFNFK